MSILYSCSDFREVNYGFLNSSENVIGNETASIPSISVVEPQGPAVDASSNEIG